MLENFEMIFEKQIIDVLNSTDPAHDILHFKRVVSSAKKIAILENADINVVVPAAWLHDYVNLPKDSPHRSRASRISAEKAVEYLKTIHYPTEYHDAIFHAIEAHSFSAKVIPLTIEAKVIQDADRLDALGAIGVARCFATAGLLKRSFYKLDDPFCKQREPEDHLYTIDHFYKKLLLLAGSMQTQAGRQEAQRRLDFMKIYLSELSREL